MKKKLCGCDISHFLTFLLPLLVIFSCNNSTQDQKPAEVKNKRQDPIHQKPPSSYSDTIAIGFSSAVFYSPDSLQLLKIKSASDTFSYRSIMHEYEYQIKFSRKALKKGYPHIKIVEVKNVRFLQFNRANGKKEFIDLNANNNTCGLYIFNVKDSPIPVDMMNIESALWFYFSK